MQKKQQRKLSIILLIITLLFNSLPIIVSANKDLICVKISITYYENTAYDCLTNIKSTFCKLKGDNTFNIKNKNINSTISNSAELSSSDSLEVSAIAVEVTEVAMSTETVVVTLQNKWGITLTDDEKELLSRIVWLESRGESDIGEQAVIEVVFNRMLLYGENVYEVLSKSKQFTSWKKRSRAVPTDRELRNIETVLNGKTNILDFNTIYFGTSPYNKRVYCKIGGHYFCNY